MALLNRMYCPQQRQAEAAKASEDAAAEFAYTVKAVRRSEQRRLVSFVRMADYRVADTLRTVLLESVKVRTRP